MLVDLRARRVIGRFSAAISNDRSYWKTVVFPVLLTIAGASIGIVELHCSCVAKRQMGLLLIGAGRSGKSTLAVALAQEGFGFLSDDRTFCSQQEGRLWACGLATTFKLRSDAGKHFKEFERKRPADLQNGERGFRFEPELALGLERVRRCEPRLLVFLERRENPGFCLSDLSSEQATARLEEDLMAELPDAASAQMEIIEKLIKLPCCLLQYGGRPQIVAEKLAAHFERLHDHTEPRNGEPAMRRTEVPVKRSDCLGEMAMSSKVPSKMKRKDLLRRFTPTPNTIDLLVMGRTVRLESNSRVVVDSAMEFFARHQGSSLSRPEFLWRILSEEDSKIEYAGVALSAFSDGDLRFANLGQGSFLAVDLEAREGIGFIAERLVESEPKLHCRSIFDTLFCMSTGSLGMVPLAAACVGRGDKGLLLFGAPNSGKTTVSYLAAKLGLEFHADQAAFLETEARGLRVWGDLLPAIFRPESLQFLPELKAATRRFSYPGLTVCYLPKRPFQALKAHSVDPVCCVFLERQAATIPTVLPMARFDFSRRIAESMLFKDYDCVAQQSAAVFEALERLPAYRLSFGSDPAAAVPIVRQMLADGDVQEPQLRANTLMTKI